MSDGLDLLRERGVLSELDWHFARAVARLAGEVRPPVRLAAALACRAVGQGQVCLDVPRLFDGGAVVDDEGTPVECPWPPADEWIAALHASPLVAPADRPAALTPLVLDAAGRLYLRRYWNYQTSLASALQVRAAQEVPGVDHERLADGLARLFPSDAREESAGLDWQRVAALIAVLRQLCVIAGGPGTGKTYTVVRLLALLVEQALAAGRRAPRVALLAPTGKAAARLGEAIRGGKTALPCAAAVADAIADDAVTIHRALGAFAGHRTRFRHGPEAPMAADVVLVDEASMVDLALMARLAGALPPHARLILLGDPDQLVSVEAGAVLGEICGGAAPRTYSVPFAERVATRVGVHLPRAAAAAAAGIRDCIVQLTHNYRYRSDSGIGRLARAVNAGDIEEVFAALGGGGGVTQIDPAPDGTLGPVLEQMVADGFAAYLAADDPLERLHALSRFRVLCAHRRGPFGVESVNARIEACLAADGRVRPETTFYVGRPLLITRNDYQLELFNGDVGIIAADPDQPGARVAVFLAADGAPRRLAPSRLPPHETVFAMTVHKSQGSEFDAVAVLLPEQPSRVVSRELLYTAVTRARAQATICATRAVIAHAVDHPSERASGLRDALWR